VETIDAYLDRLASADPTPGGGSAAAIVAAAGAALVAMVARITRGNAKAEARHALADALIAEADAARSDLLAARERDEHAYAGVVTAMALPKTTDDEKAKRTVSLQSALRKAAEEPLLAASLAQRVLELAERALDLENAGLASDLGCAAAFAQSSVEACAFNVRVNHRFIKDTSFVASQAARLVAVEEESSRLFASVRIVTNGVLRLTP
jgi:formiminotetrahydrofolate cyclodeaminase